MSLKDNAKAFGVGVGIVGAAAVGAGIGGAGTGDGAAGAAFGAAVGVAIGAGVSQVFGTPAEKVSCMAGVISCFTGVATLAFHLVATDAPKAPNVPVNDNSAITQQQSGTTVSCEEIAKKCGLELK